MLSKVLRGDDAESARPFAWRQSAGSRNPAPSAPVATSNAYRPPPTPSEASEAEELRKQVSALRAKVGELEGLAEVRAQQARDGAYREGENAGRVQAMAEIQPLLEKLTHSIREAAELRPKLRHEAETDLLSLALAIAKKVLHREVTADPDALSALIRVALEKVRVQEILRVRLHPQHHVPVQQLLSRMTGGAAIDLVPDARLALGGIVIETTRGEFDVSVDTQLREIERGLTDRLKSRS